MYAWSYPGEVQKMLEQEGLLLSDIEEKAPNSR